MYMPILLSWSAMASNCVLQSSTDRGVLRSMTDRGVLRSMTDRGVLRSMTDRGVLQSSTDRGVLRSMTDRIFLRSTMDRIFLQSTDRVAQHRQVEGCASTHPRAAASGVDTCQTAHQLLHLQGLSVSVRRRRLSDASHAETSVVRQQQPLLSSLSTAMIYTPINSRLTGELFHRFAKEA